jgi:hypothetical protein
MRGSVFLQVPAIGIRFLSCWIASVGIWLPTFRDISAVLSQRVEISDVSLDTASLDIETNTWSRNFGNKISIDAGEFPRITVTYTDEFY